MPGKMSLILIKDTGNVLAFASRVSVPSAFEDIADLDPEELKTLKEKELADLVGSELLVRFPLTPASAGSAEFIIESSELDVLITDPVEAVIGRPREFCVDSSGKPSAASDGLRVKDMAKDRITAEVNGAVSQDTNVWLQVRGVKEATGKGVLKPGVLSGTQVVIGLPGLPPGDYQVLAAVKGFAAVVQKFSI